MNFLMIVNLSRKTTMTMTIKERMDAVLNLEYKKFEDEPLLKQNLLSAKVNRLEDEYRDRAIECAELQMMLYLSSYNKDTDLYRLLNAGRLFMKVTEYERAINAFDGVIKQAIHKSHNEILRMACVFRDHSAGLLKLESKSMTTKKQRNLVRRIRKN